MSKTLAIVPAESGFKVSIPPEALQQKAAALAKAEGIKQPANPEEQEAAIQAASILKGLSKQAVNDHQTAKQPYWDACKAFDAKKNEFVLELDARAEEIETGIGAYQQIERDKAAAIEREKALERQRTADAEAKALRDKIAAEKEAKEAAERQIQAALDAINAKTAAEKKKAAAAQVKATEEALAAQDRQLQAEIDASEARDATETANEPTVAAEAPKASGSSITTRLEYEVTDLEALYQWDLKIRDAIGKIQGRKPLLTLFKMTVSDSAFRAALKQMSPDAINEIPGVKITYSTKAAVRAVAPALALQS